MVGQLCHSFRMWVTLNRSEHEAPPTLHSVVNFRESVSKLKNMRTLLIRQLEESPELDQMSGLSM